MTVRRSVRLAVLAAAVTTFGCAPQPAPLQPPSPADSSRNLPPAGYGTLHQEDVALKLATETVQLRVLPLDEQVTRLLSPDSYESLRRLTTSRAPEVDSAAARAGVHRATLFLVTFFGVAPRATFSPDDVTISSQNRFFRPAAILPLSPLWSELRLNQRETASAIYLFEDGINLAGPLSLEHGGASSNEWDATRRTLERERARVYSRARAAPPH